MAQQKQQDETSSSYTGKLFKKGNINKSWKERYFRIDRFKQTMKYYKEENDVNTDGLEQGSINLSEITKIEVISSYDISLIKQLKTIKYIQNNDNVKSDKQYTFQLISSGRTFVLSAQNKSQLFKWLKYLQLCLYGEVIKEGWLRKQGAMNKSWKKRYFTLNKYQQMKYYDDDKRTNCLGSIDCTKIHHINNGKIYGSDLRYTLDLNTNSRKWIIAANNKDERVKNKTISTKNMYKSFTYLFLKIYTKINKLGWAQLINVMRKKNWEQGLEKYMSKGNVDLFHQDSVWVSPQEQKEKELKVNKRPKDDVSDVENDNDNNNDQEDKTEEKQNKAENDKNEENQVIDQNLEEITNFNVIDKDNRWNKDKSFGIYDAFKEYNYFILEQPNEFIIDFGEKFKLKRVEVQFNYDGDVKTIKAYSSSSNDKDAEWKNIGNVKIKEEFTIMNETKIKLNIKDYGNDQYIKIAFTSDESTVQIRRIQFFG